MKSPEAPSTQAALAGLVERVTFHNAENGFCVLRTKARGHRDLVTVVGHSATISAGEWITATGEWVNEQFKARFLRASAPTSTEGIEKYLSSGMIRGIGPTYARKLVRAFAGKVFDVIEAGPDRLREVDGIGPVRARRIVAAWAEQSCARDHGIPAQMAAAGGCLAAGSLRRVATTPRAGCLHKECADLLGLVSKILKVDGGLCGLQNASRNMTEPCHARKYVVGPYGSPLTMANLPAPGTKRWVIRRKAEIIAAVRGGLLSLEEACSYYTLTVEEFLTWQSSIDRHGLAGLRSTRIQKYRHLGDREGPPGARPYNRFLADPASPELAHAGSMNMMPGIAPATSRSF